MIVLIFFYAGGLRSFSQIKENSIKHGPTEIGKWLKGIIELIKFD